MREREERTDGLRPTVAGVLNLLLSVTFLVLAAYIAWSSKLVAAQDALQLRLFAALMAAYGVWRWIRGIIKSRRDAE